MVFSRIVENKKKIQIKEIQIAPPEKITLDSGSLNFFHNKVKLRV